MFEIVMTVVLGVIGSLIATGITSYPKQSIDTAIFFLRLAWDLGLIWALSKIEFVPIPLLALAYVALHLINAVTARNPSKARYWKFRHLEGDARTEAVRSQGADQVRILCTIPVLVVLISTFFESSQSQGF